MTRSAREERRGICMLEAFTAAIGMFVFNH
jgi:hypothetical protein